MRPIITLTAVALALALAAPGVEAGPDEERAQRERMVRERMVRERMQRGRDPIEQNTFDPELIMRNQRALELDEGQRAAIVAEVQKAQSRLMEKQWALEGEMEALVSLLAQERIDEDEALKVLSKVLELESEVKRAHLLLAIRIKNTLSSEQQAKLRRLRERHQRE